MTYRLALGAALAAGLVACSSGSSGAGDALGPDATDAPHAEGGLDGGPDGADAGPDGADAADASDATSHADTAADAPAEAEGGSLADVAEDHDAAPPGDSGGDAPPEAEAGAHQAGSLCAASCPAGQPLCQNGCGPIDWRLSCSSACRPNAPNVGTACGVANAVPACAGVGACVPATCEPGWADCDKNPANGCEADIESPAHCGACGTACTAGQLCAPSGCVTSCTPPLTQCTDRCVDLTSDPGNCGACGTSCLVAGSKGALGTCVAGKCTTTCAQGFTSCNGGCADLQNDPKSCGTCGNACPVPTNGRAVCVAGTCGATCQPGWTLGGGACVEPVATPEWIAKGLAAPEDLAVDATRVYWTDPTAGTVSSAPLAGGTPTVLAKSQSKPWRIAVGPTDVYWTNNLGGAVMHAPKDGSGSAQVLATAIQPWGVAVAGGLVYWANTAADASGNISVESVPLAGGSPTVVQSVAQISGSALAYDLVSDGTRVLYTMGGAAGAASYQCVDAAGVHALSTATGMEWMAMDDASYYAYSGINSRVFIGYDKTTRAQNAYIPVQGGNDPQGIPDPLFTSTPGQAPPGAGDGCALYYISTSGIYMLVHGTTWPALIVASGTIHRIAAQGGYVYWTDTTGALARAATP